MLFNNDGTDVPAVRDNCCRRDGPREDRRKRRQGRGLRDTGPGPDHRPVRDGGPVLRGGEKLQPGGGQAHPLARRIGRAAQGRADVRLLGKRVRP